MLAREQGVEEQGHDEEGCDEGQPGDGQGVGGGEQPGRTIPTDSAELQGETYLYLEREKGGGGGYIGHTDMICSGKGGTRAVGHTL